MKVLLFADFRSPHALGWAAGVEGAGIETVRVASLGEASTGAAAARRGAGQQMARNLSAKTGHRVRTAEALARQRNRRAALRRAVSQFGPDLVHALRLPYEGVSALSAVGDRVPVVVSTWGQDFVAQAAADPVLRTWIRRTLPRVAGLIADVPEDLVRADSFGLPDVPTAVAAANFGLEASKARPLDLAAPMVTYTRGVAPHINYVEFLKAIPEILAHARTAIRFTGIGLTGLPEAESLASDPRIGPRLTLTGRIGLGEFNAIVAASAATCSPATSDGMPISVLASLAEGCPTLVASLPQYEELAPQVPSLVIMRGADRRAIAEAVLELDQRWAAAVGPTMTTPAIPDIYDRARNAAMVPEFYSRVLHEHGLK